MALVRKKSVKKAAKRPAAKKPAKKRAAKKKAAAPKEPKFETAVTGGSIFGSGSSNLQ